MHWQFITNGLITGILYSLLAIGFALVFNAMRIFQIAVASIYVFTAYIFWLLATSQNISVSHFAYLTSSVLTIMFRFSGFVPFILFK